MVVFMVAEALVMGGAEWFLLRQCVYLKQMGHDVHLYVVRPDMVDQRILNQFPDIKYTAPSLTLTRLAVFFDRVLNKLFKKPFLVDILNINKLKSEIRRIKPDAIHSHLLQTDYKVAKANEGNHIQHVITVHGDYIGHIKDNEEIHIRRLDQVLRMIDKVAVITAEQQQMLLQHMPELKDKIVKIYNGYLVNEIPLKTELPGIFTFGLVARAIPEKGWEPAIEAFLLLNHPDARLSLWGEGPFMDELKQKYKDPRIHFGGFTNAPLREVQAMDVGLFPSYYPPESLPTTIIEYLVLHKPVITTAVGECREMIKYQDDYAGIVIGMKQGKPDITELAQAMKRMIDDKAFYQHCVAVAEKAKEKFEMATCMDQYIQIYKK